MTYASQITPITLLLAVLLFAGISDAAQCCGWRSHDYNEDQLWNLRAQLCNNPYGQERSGNGFIAKTEVRSSNSLFEYAFWMRDGSSSSCWQATQELIEQCFRGGSGAGSWEYDGQLYTISGTSLGQYKRAEINNGSAAPFVEDLPLLPGTMTGSLESIKLPNGTYNVHGRPVRIAVSGINLDGQKSSHPTRGEDQLMTNSGPVTNFTLVVERNVDLEAAINSIINKVAGGGQNDQQVGLSRRGQTCQTSSDYVMLEYGTWLPDYKLASGLFLCSQCTHTASISTTTSETFSIGITGGLDGEIAKAAWSLGYSWERSHTIGTTQACPWTQGGCHTVWTQQSMSFQGGFALDAWAWNEMQVEVRINWVHSDAPINHDSIDCRIGCCSNAVTSVAGTWNNCHWANDSNRCFYGTCATWEANCNGVIC